MDRLKAIATFVRIVDAGSLSAAAEMSGQSAASVVRTLAALEAYLGVRLLNRNTRRLALTDEGAEFLAWGKRILAEFDDIEHSFDVRRSHPGGLLRITASVEFGSRYVAPLVNAFLADHQAIRVELTLLDHMVDMLEEGLDLAIRIGRLPDSSMVAVPLGVTRLVVCASPAYLRDSDPLSHPSSLHQHDCVAFASQGKHWHFLEKGVALTETVPARLQSNQVRAVCQAGLQGVGVIRLLHYQVADELGDGRLIRLLRDFEPPDIPVQMVYPNSRLLSSRVRQFIDWIAPRLRAIIPDPS